MGQHSSKSAPPISNASAGDGMVVPTTTSSIHTGHHSSSSVASVPRSMYTRCKHKLSRIELYSLHQTFDELKTAQHDRLECIQVKEFLAHLDLPASIEPAGILLFKAFSYLGSYGNGPPAAIRLTFPAFVTAFVLLTGKMDDDEEHPHTFGSMLFESLAIPSSEQPDGDAPVPPQTSASKAEDSKPPTAPNAAPNEATTAAGTGDGGGGGGGGGGLSLADLGVDFSDMDFDALGDTTHAEQADSDDGSSSGSSNRILARDLVELFMLLLWITRMERAQGLLASGSNMIEHDPTTTDDEDERRIAQQLVASMASPSDSNKAGGSSSGGGDDDEHPPVVAERVFFGWQRRNAPRLFQTLQSFLYSKFAIHHQASFTTTNSSTLSDLVLLQDVVSVPDVSDILTLPMCALLAWSPLPDVARQIKKWPRLYSGYADGFAMNRFESHVFKYPGPTLVVIQGEVKNVGVRTWVCYVHDKWRQSRQHYWGSDACFVAELAPTFEAYPATHANTQYIYYHSDFGIAFGGTTTKHGQPPPKPIVPSPSNPNSDLIHVPTGFLLTIDNTLQRGIYSQEPYPDRPTLLASASRKRFYEPFETVNIEVFGMGDEKARQVQEREWAFEKREALRRAGLQFRQPDGNKVDHELLRMAGIIDDDNRQER